MFKIIKKEPLNPSMTRMVIEAPFVARKAMPGQFIILRVNETGERIPLTIADYDREAGTVTIIYQKVGKSTLLLDEQEADAPEIKEKASALTVAMSKVRLAKVIEERLELYRAFIDAGAIKVPEE